MSMRLLSKSEVTQAKALERQKEIEEGVKLAKRVDALREVGAEEEKSLSKFRSETILSIKNEITAKLDERDTLVKEVEELREERRVLMEPLTEEKQKLENQKQELQKVKKELDERNQELVSREIGLNGREKDIIIQERRADDMHSTQETLLREAGTLRDEMERKEREANEQLRKAYAEAETIMQNAKVKETNINRREEAVLKKEDLLREKEIELEKEWEKLKDREATFIRNKNRK